MTKNYYKILGVTELCSEQELKIAYRKLARQWHPDIAGNTPDILAKFKDINEAYEVLSNQAKRAEYDTLNRYYNYSANSADTNKSNTTRPDNHNASQNEEKQKEEHKEETENQGFNFNWNEFVSKYKEYTNQFENIKKHLHSEPKEEKKTNAKYGNAVRGQDINTDVEISITEAINGTTKIINMLNTTVCSHCGGRRFINGALCSHCKGKGEHSEYKRLNIKIPAGIRDNSKIRLAGEGEQGKNGGKNGDLFLTVHIKSPLDYTTDGNNILKKIIITPFEAVLGANIAVKTLDENVNVKISPNTQNGQKIRLSGCGINLNGKIGDMILTVEIQIPKNPSLQEIELYKKLREISSQNVRQI